MNCIHSSICLQDSVSQIDSGYVNATPCDANGTKDVSVEFDVEFSSVPQVVGLSTNSTASVYGNISVAVVSTSRSGFTLRFFNSNSGPREPSARWIAVEQ